MMQLKFVPDEECLTPLVALLKAAKTRIRICAYSFDVKAITDAVVNAHLDGIDVACVFDLSESIQKWEVPYINELKTNKVPLKIGTSVRSKAIIHTKLAIIDNTAFYGSANFTHSGLLLEDNIVIIDDDPTRLASLLSNWQRLWDSIK